VSRILVSGSTGLIGSAVVAALRQRGDSVFTLVRHGRGLSGAEIYWRPEDFFLPDGLLSEMDAVIHLAGSPIADSRWTAAQKKVLWNSRIQSTRLLVNQALVDRPKRMLFASATGYYGTSIDLPTDESSVKGMGFLSDLCAAWEHETAVLASEGLSCATMRFGVVLSPKGGALSKMLPVFRLGMGGAVGTGQQWMSWISLRDVVGAILFLIDKPSLTGVVNMTSPEPITNAVFSETLARILYERRLVDGNFLPLWPRAFMRVPTWVLRAAFGEMAKETVLASHRVLPSRLVSSGFQWKDRSIDSALTNVLSRRLR
jgi:uncharacterized protein